MNKLNRDVHVYTKLLNEYLSSNDPVYLKDAEKLSKSFVSKNIFPEEIVRMHIEAIQQIYGGVSENYKRSLLFLFESMHAYTSASKAYQNLVEEQIELKSEIEVAASMQETLLLTDKPHISNLDIGAISVPYHQMNGDYYHFVQGEDDAIGIAIADIIGKGVPAALSMSMIKYSLDSFYDASMSPKGILRYLNRVVERNVASNMFITMFYGQYFPSEDLFRYASAGHEPGFLYRAKDDSFTEIHANGIVLGVLPDVEYEEIEVTIDDGDMIVLLTDGVTECRYEGRFITRGEVIEVIKEFAHLNAQEHVERVYDYFTQLNNFELKDDFTLIIVKKV